MQHKAATSGAELPTHLPMQRSPSEWQVGFWLSLPGCGLCNTSCNVYESGCFKKRHADQCSYALQTDFANQVLLEEPGAQP